jgi:hypothetical protein
MICRKLKEILEFIVELDLPKKEKVQSQSLHKIVWISLIKKKEIRVTLKNFSTVMYFNKFSMKIKLSRSFSLDFHNLSKAQSMGKMYVYLHTARQGQAKPILCWVWVKIFKIKQELFNREVWSSEVLSLFLSKYK